ncbi:hypothetical protein [Hymenobacter glacieicola]|uniref:Uncharacterized protein n=1 Tax=Hymenobacter glacieicola TaxID=1562124 RepID=A0ABQ1X7Z8_9BACT|nr:hypothetical protein [Hymenobacter glacieicola]GGG60513.1 hypothetical protein GCM10011378_40670 [Hymenobacter glacieicola]
MENTFFKGRFKILDFSIAHKILLIRKEEVVNHKFKNTDLLFAGTFFIELPTILDDISIFLGNEEDYEYLRGKMTEELILENLNTSSIFCIKSCGLKYYVVADTLEINENDYDPSETSIGLKRKP